MQPANGNALSVGRDLMRALFCLAFSVRALIYGKKNFSPICFFRVFFFSPECFSSSSSSIRFLLRSRFLIIIWYGSICIYLYTISFRFMMMTALYANCCVKTISHDLLELLEKLQTSRLDDQRCVLPAYFTTQVNLFLFSGKCFSFLCFAFSSLYHLEC